MMRSGVEAALIALSVVVLGLIWRERLRAFAGFPVILAAVLGAVGDMWGGSIELKLWGAACVAYCVGVLVHVTCNPASEAGAVGASRLVALTLVVVWCLSVDLMSGLDPAAHLLAYALVIAALVASAVLAARGGIDHATPAYAGLLVVAISDIVGAFTASAWRPCDQFKCSVLHGLFRGPYASENFLALIATITLAWLVVSTAGRLRQWGCALCAVTIFATGSRTALVVGAVAVLLPLVVSRVWPPLRYGSGRVPTVFAAMIGGGVSVTGVYLLEHASRGSFSNRGEVWLQALAMITGHRATGVGSSSYAVFQQQGLVSYHFTHSEYLLLLFAGGYVAVALFTGWAAITVRALARNGGSVLATIPIVAYTVYGMTEVSWNPVAFDSYAWIALSLCLTRKVSAVAHTAKEPHGDAVLVCRPTPAGNAPRTQVRPVPKGARGLPSSSFPDSR